jgi:hypothetical protein
MKLEGVQNAEVSLEKSSATITLKADNRVTLPLLRRTIRNSGYPTREAQIEARGRIAERDGKPVLDLMNGSMLELVSAPASSTTDPVLVIGVSREEKAIERLTVTSVELHRGHLHSVP